MVDYYEALAVASEVLNTKPGCFLAVYEYLDYIEFICKTNNAGREGGARIPIGCRVRADGTYQFIFDY